MGHCFRATPNTSLGKIMPPPPLPTPMERWNHIAEPTVAAPPPTDVFVDQSSSVLLSNLLYYQTISYTWCTGQFLSVGPVVSSSHSDNCDVLFVQFLEKLYNTLHTTLHFSHFTLFLLLWLDTLTSTHSWIYHSSYTHTHTRTHACMHAYLHSCIHTHRRLSLLSHRFWLRKMVVVVVTWQQ